MLVGHYLLFHLLFHLLFSVSHSSVGDSLCVIAFNSIVTTWVTLSYTYF